MASNANEDLIRSHVDTIVLSSLMNEDKYGLEILNEIKEKSNGLYSLKQATLYSILKRLEKVGFIKSYNGSTSNGAARVYYSLLEDGRNAVLSDQYEWEYSRTIINNLLSDKDYDPNATPPFDASELRPLTKRQPSVKTEEKTNTQPIEQVQEQPFTKPKTQFVPTPVSYDTNENDDNYYDNSNYQANIYHNPAPKPAKPSFESIFNTPVDTKQNIPIVPSTPSYENVQKDNTTTNYISVFDNMYQTATPSKSDEVSGINIEEDSLDYLTINDLKANFAKEGFVVRPYIKKNTTEYYVGKYYKANKLLLFSSLLFYAIMLIEIFAIHFGLGYPKLYTLGLSIAAISIVPAYALIKWLMDPNKRSLAKFNIKTALINSLIIIINLVIIIVIVGYFAFKANFSDINTMIQPIFAPLGMLLNIPLAIVIYEVLYRSKYFHIN